MPARIARLGDPSAAKVLDGRVFKVVERRFGADLGRKIPAALGEDLPELVFRHRDEAITVPAPVDALVLDRSADRPGGHVEDENAAVGMVDFVKINPERKALTKALTGPFWLVECLRADDPTRPLVADAENDLPPPLFASAAEYFTSSSNW